MKRYVLVQNSMKTLYNFRASYIKLLLDSGAKVHCIAPLDCQSSYIKLKRLGVHVSYIKRQKGRFANLKLLFFMHIKVLVLSHKYRSAIFICHFLVTYLMAVGSFYLIRNRVLISVEGIGSLALRGPLYQRFFRTLLSSTSYTRVFCNSDEKKLLGQSNDRITGGIGVDCQRFNIVRKQFGEVGEVNFLFVGRLIGDKGIDVAIRTFEKVQRVYPLCKLTVVGEIFPSNPSSLLASDIKNLSVKFDEKIKFVGYADDVGRYYKVSDVLLLPSKMEGFPLCVMEASASGVPSICFDVPGCRDAIKNDVNGFLVDSGNEEKYLECVLSLVESPALREAMSKAAREHAKINFDRVKKDKQFTAIAEKINSRESVR